MGREFARYLTTNHHDPDWFEMTTTQHDVYMALVSSPNITWAGVVPYVPQAFAGLAKDLNEKKIVRVWRELEALNKLVIDESTGEVCARTFLRHDKVLSKPNIAIAFCKAFPLVRSAVIRRSITVEVTRLHREHGHEWAKSWDIIREQSPELFERVTETV